MAGTASVDSGVARSLEGRCQSVEARAEWRSSDQVENGTPSTSPPYWDTDDDDDCGPKPSELYGKYTWKIDKFSQINKRELRSNAFEVGGYKWYILIYPQGCDVCNHLSLFLCVANHDKLLPGWSHFAQFTIAVVNKDPKKSKYSDTLHRFWKKEHDWGWKKFMELNKVNDGFIDADTLIIKAQVQVIRERADRPFRCLDCQYRRELVRVYLTNVEQACRHFVEESRTKLGKLIEDKSRWTSFCSFWIGIDQSIRRRMSREKTDSILKAVVKKFFIEKEVTSTLVMDSLFSGLKALEGQIKNKKVAKGKHLDAEEKSAPIIRLEKDTFVLVDDVLLLIERVAMEPLPPKDEKGPQNRTKDGSSGEDSAKDSVESDERLLTDLGRRTIEIFVLAHIYSKIEVAYQEAVALKRQEELIREEEAACLAECDQKAKRAALEKEKKSKKKLAKQKRNNRKGKDKGKEERSVITIPDKNDQESQSEKPEMAEDVSDASDLLDCVPEIIQPDPEETVDSSLRFTANWDIDTPEVLPPSIGPNGSRALSSAQNGERKSSPSLKDDSSSTCSTDSLPSVVMNGPYKGSSRPNQKPQKSPSRGKNQRGKVASDTSVLANEVTGSKKATEPESEAAVVNDLHDRIKRLEQHVFKKEEEVVSLQRKLTDKDEVDLNRPKKQTTAEVPHSPSTPPVDPPSVIRKPESPKTAPNPPTISVPAKKPSIDIPQPSDKPVSSAEPMTTTSMPHPTNKPPASSKPAEKPPSPPSPPLVSTEKPISQKPVPVPTEKPTAMSRPLSAPLIPGPRPAAAPVVSMVQTAPLLSRSVSAAGRLGRDPSPYIPQSYRNAMMGNHIPATSSGYAPPHPPPHSPSSTVTSSSVAYSQQPLMMSSSIFLPENPPTVRSSPSFGILNPSLINDFQSMDLYNNNNNNNQLPVYRSQDLPSSVSRRQYHGVVNTDEFPHIDIINDLLDDEIGVGPYMDMGSYRSFGNGPHHLHRQFTFPGDDVGPSSSCRFERRGSHDEFQHGYSSAGVGQGQFDMMRDMVPQANLMPYTNGHIDSGMVPNEWQMGGSDLSYLGLRNGDDDGYAYHHMPEYPSVNGYPVFRPSNGH